MEIGDVGGHIYNRLDLVFREKFPVFSSMPASQINTWKYLPPYLRLFFLLCQPLQLQVNPLTFKKKKKKRKERQLPHVLPILVSYSRLLLVVSSPVF